MGELVCSVCQFTSHLCCSFYPCDCGGKRW